MFKLIKSIIKRHIISLFVIFTSVAGIIKHKHKENIFVSSSIALAFVVFIHINEFGHYVARNHNNTQELKSMTMNAKGLSLINAFFKGMLIPFRHYKEFILKY
ncbi:MAG: hypothetical protein AB7D27_03315 [Desulfomicrobium sp.]